MKDLPGIRWISAPYFHLKVFLAIRWSMLFSLITRERKEIPEHEHLRALAAQLIKIGERVEQRPLPAVKALFRPYRIWIRCTHYAGIVAVFAMLPHEWAQQIEPEELKRIIHFAELWLELYQDGGAEYVAVRSKRSRLMPAVFRERLAAAEIYRLLAKAYCGFHPGDLVLDLKRGIECFAQALEVISGLTHPMAQLLYSEISVEIAEAYLTHPFDTEFVCKARTALEESAKVLDAYQSLPAPDIKFGGAVLTGLEASPASERRQRATKVVDIVLSRKRLKGGIPGGTFMRLRMQETRFKLDYQLGLVYMRLGEGKKAISFFERALANADNPDKRIEAMTELGWAILHTKSHESQWASQMKRGIRTFDQVIESSTDAKFNLPLIRAIIGKTKALLVLRTVIDEHEKAGLRREFDMEIRNLRIVLRVARAVGQLHWSRDIAEALGMVHLARREYESAFRAFLLAARVENRIHNYSRTVRLKHYRSGEAASIYNSLIFAASCYRRKPIPGAALNEFSPRRVARRAMVTFSERARAVFLQEELCNANILPSGHTGNLMGGLFASRTALHEAELALIHSDTLLDHSHAAVLKQRRNLLEEKYLRTLRRVREEIQDQTYDPDVPTVPAAFREIRNAVEELSEKECTAFVEFHISANRLYTFVVLPRRTGSPFTFFFEDHSTLVQDLEQIAREWGVHPTEDGRGNQSRTSDSATDWLNWGRGSLAQALDRLSPLVEFPVRVIRDWESDTGSKVSRVIIAPHKFLHRVPLHAVGLSTGDRFGEEFECVYVPSGSVLCRLLDSKRKQHNQPTGNTAVAIAGPSEFGSFLSEAANVAEILRGALLNGSERNLEEVMTAIENAQYIHFACHGSFDKRNVLNSGLICAIKSEGLESCRTPVRLTLGTAFERLRLRKFPVVVLSGCDTGISRIERMQDEYIGFPAGFFYAGARTVVSSLWPVADPAVRLMMTHMTERIALGASVSKALSAAQQWLRRLSYNAAKQELLRHSSENEISALQAAVAADGEFPFENPYWWAGFTVNGLG